MKEKHQIEKMVRTKAKELDREKTSGDKKLIHFNSEKWAEGVIDEWTKFVAEVPVGTPVRHRHAHDRNGMTEDGGYYDNPMDGNGVNVGDSRIWAVAIVEKIPQ